MGAVGELPEIKLTATVRAVLAALVDQHGVKLPVSQIARQAHLSATTVRVALDALGKARLVQHMLLPSSENRPPRLGFWLTGAGHDVATASKVPE